ncbi:MAG: response regulator [Thermoleophilia bacterium]
MSCTVLLVDDDAFFTESLKDGLLAGNPQYGVATANNVDEATELLDKNSVDLVVTDLKMPGKSGFDLLAHLVRYHPDVPAIVMTAFGTPEMEQQALDLGALRVLAKPVDFVGLRSQIEEALEPAPEGAPLQGVSPAGLLQLLELERTTCVVYFTLGERKARIAVVDGTPRDARCGEVRGEDAFFEMLRWSKPQIALGNLRWNLTRSIDRSMQELLLEDARHRDERVRDGVATGGESGVDQSDDPFASAGGQEEKSTVIGGTARPNLSGAGLLHTSNEYGRSLEFGAEKEQSRALETLLAELKSVDGYVACGVMSFAGEVLACHSTDSMVDVRLVGAAFNDIFRSAHAASDEIGMKPCNEIVIMTPLGQIILRCSGADSPAHVHVMAVMRSDGNRALMEMNVEKILPKAVAELI